MKKFFVMLFALIIGLSVATGCGGTSTSSTSSSSSSTSQVEDTTLSSISVKTLPYKLKYYSHETINTAGGQIELAFTNNTKQVIDMSDDMVNYSSVNMATLGQQNVELRYTYKGVTKSTTYQVEIEDSNIYVTNIYLDKDYAEIMVGGGVALKEIVLPKNATNQAVEWVSSDPSIAIVSNQGVVEGLKEGSVVITVTAKDKGTKIATATIVVKNPTDDTITVTLRRELTLSLQTVYEKYDSSSYTSSNYEILTGYYNEGIEGISSAKTSTEANAAFVNATRKMALVAVNVTTPVVDYAEFSFSGDNLTITSGGLVNPTSLGRSVVANLVIAASVGDEEVTLDGITVTGTTTVNGGGSHSIIAVNVVFVGTITIDKDPTTGEETVRVEFSVTTTVISDIVVADNATLTANTPLPSVTVNATVTTALIQGSSSIGQITAAASIEVDIDGVVDSLEVSSGATSAPTITVNSIVQLITNNYSGAEIEGNGQISNMIAAVSTTVAVTVPVNNVELSGGTLTVNQPVNNVVVTASTSVVITGSSTVDYVDVPSTTSGTLSVSVANTIVSNQSLNAVTVINITETITITTGQTKLTNNVGDDIVDVTALSDLKKIELAKLERKFAALNSLYYSSANYSIISDNYDDVKAAINASADESELDVAKANIDYIDYSDGTSFGSHITASAYILKIEDNLSASIYRGNSTTLPSSIEVTLKNPNGTTSTNQSVSVTWNSVDQTQLGYGVHQVVGEFASTYLNSLNLTPRFSINVAQPITATLESLDNYGIHDSKVYAAYKLMHGETEIGLTSSNLTSISVLKPGDETPTVLTPDSDPYLWFNVNNAAGAYQYNVLTKNGTAYRVVFNWSGPLVAEFVSTGRVGDHESVTYSEHEMYYDDEAVSIAASNIELIAAKSGDNWSELTANTDSTLWFNVTHDVADYEFIVVTNDGNIYKAVLDWNGPATYSGTVEGIIATSETGAVSAVLDFGDEDLIVAGQVTGQSGQIVSFTGTVSGAIEGNISGQIHVGGIDTLAGIITDCGAVLPVRILGIFPQSGVHGEFEGRIVTEEIPVMPTSMTITGDSFVYEDDTIQLAISSSPELSASNIAWAVYVNNREIASVSQSGIVTGLSKGTAIIIAKSLDGSLLQATKTITIGVKPVINSRTETKYTSLQTAINEAVTGDTIVLRDDVDLGSNSALIENKSLILDLAGYSITSSTGNWTIRVSTGATLAINDSSEGNTGSVINTGQYGEVLRNYGTLIINGGTYSATHADGGYALIMSNRTGTTSYTSVTTINDGTFNGWVYDNGTDGYCRLVINDGVFTRMLYIASAYSDVEINGGTFTSTDESLIEIKAGTLTINGGTFAHNIDTTDNISAIASNSSSGPFKGVIIGVKPSGSTTGAYGSPVVINLNGGTFSNTLGDVIVLADQTTKEAHAGSVTVNVTANATITAASDKNAIAVYDNSSINNDGCAVNVYDGTITGNYYKHDYGTNDDDSYINENAQIIAVDSFEELKSGLANSSNGSIICLNGNVEFGEPAEEDRLLVPVNKKIILDLNGYTLQSSTYWWVIKVDNGARLTINDSSADKTGMILNTTYMGEDIRNAGRLIINGGTYRTTGESGSNYGGYSIYMSSTSVITIDGGVFEGWIYNNGSSTNTGSLTINGGDFRRGIYLASANNNVTINGGTFHATEVDLLALIEIDAGTLTINGGTFTNNVDTSINTEASASNNGSGAFKGVIVGVKPSGSTTGAYGSPVVINLNGGRFSNTLGDVIVLADQTTNEAHAGSVTVNVTANATITAAIDKNAIAIYDDSAIDNGGCVVSGSDGSVTGIITIVENRGLDSSVAGIITDTDSPTIDSVSPAEGSLSLGPSETFIFVVDAADAVGLYELEIDHSMSATLPEFSLYADSTNVYGDSESATQFTTAGVQASYDETEQKWSIDFGTNITDAIVTNGGITIYIVVEDLAGNQFGSMYSVTDDNTFAYTVTRAS